MLTSDFKAAISDKNIIRTKIMLKDSLIIDPTFVQFEEMLFYAKEHLPEILVPFDGEQLENNKTKWNKNVMNDEMTQLISNFSEERIDHLKKVIAEVLKNKVAEIWKKRGEEANRQIKQSNENKNSLDKNKKTIGQNFQGRNFSVTFTGDWDPVVIDGIEGVLGLISKLPQNKIGSILKAIQKLL